MTMLDADPPLHDWSGDAQRLEAAKKLLQQENDYLCKRVEQLEDRMPTDDELAYLRARKVQDEWASKTIKWLKDYTPWVFSILSALGALTYWAMTNLHIGPPAK